MRQALHHAPLDRTTAALMALVAALLLSLALALLPRPAFAATGSYAIEELSTEAIAQTDGSLHVIERQTLTFDESCAGIVWYLHAPESGESVRIANVRVAPVDMGGTLLGEWIRLQMVDANPRQQGRNPGDHATPALRQQASKQPWYSYSIGDGMVRACFRTDSEAGYRTYTVETDYTIYHRVRIFRDVAELYWRYANDSLPADARNVTLQIVLPVPAETDPLAVRESIMAWGHGPDQGTFAIADDGTVTYLVELVPKGNYAEAHVIFPATWENDAPVGAANRFVDRRQADAIAEESGWVDLALREAAWDNKVRVLFLAIALIVIAAGIVSVIRNGRSPKTRRALMRIAATLGVIALGENLFFHEPLTTLMLAGLAAVVACAGIAVTAAPTAGASVTAGVSVDDSEHGKTGSSE